MELEFEENAGRESDYIAAIQDSYQFLNRSEEYWASSGFLVIPAEDTDQLFLRVLSLFAKDSEQSLL